MHELAIAQSIVDLVEACATEHDAAQVKSVRLQIGEASGIVPDSLTFSFEVLASLQPLLSGASLLIEIVPHRARCRRCAQEYRVENFVAQCSTCQTWESEVISGTELQILEIEIACQHSKEQQPCPK